MVNWNWNPSKFKWVLPKLNLSVTRSEEIVWNWGMSSVQSLSLPSSLKQFSAHFLARSLACRQDGSRQTASNLFNRNNDWRSSPPVPVSGRKEETSQGQEHCDSGLRCIVLPQHTPEVSVLCLPFARAHTCTEVCHMGVSLTLNPEIKCQVSLSHQNLFLTR